MTEAVVDVLESVNVDKENCWLKVGFPRRSQRCLNVLQHKYAVRKSGQ